VGPAISLSVRLRPNLLDGDLSISVRQNLGCYIGFLHPALHDIEVTDIFHVAEICHKSHGERVED